MNKPYLQQVIIENKTEDFPFNLASIGAIKEIRFDTPVTFIVGENGAGKSTLVEAIAVSMGLNAEGGNRSTSFETKETHSSLHEHFRLIKGACRPKNWYFLRAESFYNVASLVDEVGYLETYGGKSLHKQSHGESFMAVLSHKLRGNGFYIFDEPEAALSPSRQLAALVEFDRLVKTGSQLIIATHSPILLAYPNSTIYQLDDSGLTKVKYEDTDHYKITKAFLNKRELMIKELFA